MTLIAGLLCVALVVVVPLALEFLEVTRGPRLAAAAAGAVASSSFLVDEGSVAGAIAATWLLVPLTLAARHLAQRRWGFEQAVSGIAVIYLLMGAGWLVTSRSGARPFGFGDVVVELTAVHFHYAGAVASLLALQLVTWLRASGSRHVRVATIALVLVVTATAVTAAGFALTTPSLGALGALMFSVGLVLGAALILSEVRPVIPNGGLLLTVSALSVVASMALAIAYSTGEWLGTPAPTIAMMARTHGMLNAFGFCLAGILGWRLEVRSRPLIR